MGVTFKTRKYTCSDCGHKGKKLLAFARISEILSYFHSEDIIPAIENSDNSQLLYEEKLTRDDYGIITCRQAFQSTCDKCGLPVYADKEENFNNVLNFYGPSTSERWLNGFEK
jgi:hypothetical protein